MDVELSIKFRGLVEPAGIPIPVAAVTALGACSRDRLLVTVNGESYLSPLIVIGERSLVGVSGSIDVAPGQLVDVELATEARQLPLPRFARQRDRRAMKVA